jgi:hypothetical protein
LADDACRSAAHVQTSLCHLILKIEQYVAHWNANAEPFQWTATSEEIIEKVAIFQRECRKLLANKLKIIDYDYATLGTEGEVPHHAEANYDDAGDDRKSRPFPGLGRGPLCPCDISCGDERVHLGRVEDGWDR